MKLPQISGKSLAIISGVIAVGVVGSTLLIISHAATPVGSLQAESGTLSATATSITDSTASGSHAVKFGSGSTGGGGGGILTNNCLSNPHACGFPDATNTGVPAGTTLTTVKEMFILPVTAKLSTPWTFMARSGSTIQTLPSKTLRSLVAVDQRGLSMLAIAPL